MSIVSVLETRATTGSVFLTPKKKRRLSDANQLLPSTAEIYKWVFTSSAIAPCFICDVRVMKRHKEKGEEFWWLKRVPCRTVKIVGVVVGIQTYEKRISYLVDDGTSVIECVHKCASPLPTTRIGGNKKEQSVTPDPVLPKPVAWVGNTVEIIGRIHEFESKETTEEHIQEPKDTRRQIQVQEIVRCQSVNDQLRHWQTVLDLHEMKYSLSEPFSIPISTPSQQSKVSTPSSATSVMSSTSISTTASSNTSISTSSSTSSPTKADDFQAPRKLRHPSRLHTADLTGNTFRIYIKHYMNNRPLLEDLDTESDFSDDDDGASIAGPSTPTKRPLRNDQTPRRCSYRASCTVDETPRPNRTLTSSTPPSRRGFTLSYLRRVPELSELARRVVEAEAKRRDREAKKKAREASRSSQGRKTQVVEEPANSSTVLSDKSLSSRMKRLWTWAILQLIEEGSIVLWDGPKYSLASDWLKFSMNEKIWKYHSSTTVTDASLFSSSSRDTEDDYDLSDPQADEEAYIALTAELLAEEILRSVQTWTKSRHMSESAKFTKDGILQRLRRDDRWRKVGEWHVGEALDFLESKGLMYQATKNVWQYSWAHRHQSSRI
ncbi:hypothetical protein F5880DRAFT_1492718 [Lentinula raphanica]|nr:hypothetical protein F5880DRAFT_1492718 [Lentinula raphanica]